MDIGPRRFKGASLRLAEPDLPAHMRPHMREIVSVLSENRQKGEASRLLHQVCAEADKARMTLILMPKPFDEGMTAEQLEKWYSKFGFERIQDDPVLMARQVQPNRIIH